MAGDYKAPPTCLREPGEPYSKRHYQMTRAEIAVRALTPSIWLMLKMSWVTPPANWREGF
jgi:hypothetical protein